jgi:hypothetical protein
MGDWYLYGRLFSGQHAMGQGESGQDHLGDDFCTGSHRDVRCLERAQKDSLSQAVMIYFFHSIKDVKCTFGDITMFVC